MSVFRNLPAGYTQLEYIESSGSGTYATQYIHTDVKFSKDDVVKCKLIQKSDGFIFGDNNNVFCLNGSMFQFGSSGSCTNRINITSIKNRLIEFTLDRNRLIHDGSEYDMPYPDITSYGGGLRVFWAIQDASNRIVKACMYSFEVVGKINLIPCINPSNEVGMYDTISKQFFGNSGTGEFIAGPVIA